MGGVYAQAVLPRASRCLAGLRHNEPRMSAAAIEIREEQIADFCRRNSIQKLSLFGSVLTPRFSPASDVDVLVEFQPGVRVGYLRMAALERELSAIIDGRKIDLRTPAELSKYFRDEVLRSAAVQYAAR